MELSTSKSWICGTGRCRCSPSTRAASGTSAYSTYSTPVVLDWNRKIKEGDSYLVITPEYNHSIPGVLKNAIDSVFVSFGLRNKPIASVAYSGGIAGGVRAIEHLAHIAIQAELVPLRNSVVIPFVRDAFDDDGRPKNPMTDAALQIELDDLAWWSNVLQLPVPEASSRRASFACGKRCRESASNVPRPASQLPSQVGTTPSTPRIRRPSPLGCRYVHSVPRTVQLRELLVGVEGLALLRHLYDGTDADAERRLAEVQLLLADDSLGVASRRPKPMLERVTRPGRPGMTSRGTRSSCSKNLRCGRCSSSVHPSGPRRRVRHRTSHASTGGDGSHGHGHRHQSTDAPAGSRRGAGSDVSRSRSVGHPCFRRRVRSGGLRTGARGRGRSESGDRRARLVSFATEGI